MSVADAPEKSSACFGSGSKYTCCFVGFEHDHLNLLGRYSFSLPDAVQRGQLRALSNPAEATGRRRRPKTLSEFSVPFLPNNQIQVVTSLPPVSH